MNGGAAGRFCRKLADCLSALGSVKPLRVCTAKIHLTGIIPTLAKSEKRNGYTLPSCEFQPVCGKIFRQWIFKALNSYNV
jgi:hypothetical protein